MYVYICFGFELFVSKILKNYRITDYKEDINLLYSKYGNKRRSFPFLNQTMNSGQ